MEMFPEALWRWSNFSLFLSCSFDEGSAGACCSRAISEGSRFTANKQRFYSSDSALIRWIAWSILFSLPLSLYSTPSRCFSSPSCHPIAPPVPFPPPKQLLFSPHQMVPKKEPLSRLVLPRSYLLIGKPRGENKRYWLPYWVKLLGRTSGGVRKDDILHPRLPCCCQNSLHCHSTCSVPFYPVTAPLPHLTSFLDLPKCPPLTVLCRFLSLLVKCIAKRSSRLWTEALAFHTLPELRSPPHLSPSPNLSSLK